MSECTHANRQCVRPAHLAGRAMNGSDAVATLSGSSSGIPSHSRTCFEQAPDGNIRVVARGGPHTLRVHTQGRNCKPTLSWPSKRDYQYAIYVPRRRIAPNSARPIGLFFSFLAHRRRWRARPAHGCFRHTLGEREWQKQDSGPCCSYCTTLG